VHEVQYDAGGYMKMRSWFGRVEEDFVPAHWRHVRADARGIEESLVGLGTNVPVRIVFRPLNIALF